MLEFMNRYAKNYFASQNGEAVQRGIMQAAKVLSHPNRSNQKVNLSWRFTSVAISNPITRVTCIYKITSPSGRIYIGQSRHVNQRFRFYRYDKRKGKQPKLDNSFFKYGVAAHRFEVIHWLPNGTPQERLDYYEQLYMDSYRGMGHRLLNSKEGGYRGGLDQAGIEKIRAKLMGHAVSAETREKLRRVNTGRRHTATAKEKVGRAWRGKKRGPMSEEHKKKLSARRMGREPWNKGKTGVYSEEHRHKIKQARAVQPKIVYTDEMRERMREAAKKRGISEETRQKMHETKRRQAQKTRESSQPCLNF